MNSDYFYSLLLTRLFLYQNTITRNQNYCNEAIKKLILLIADINFGEILKTSNHIIIME